MIAEWYTICCMKQYQIILTVCFIIFSFLLNANNSYLNAQTPSLDPSLTPTPIQSGPTPDQTKEAQDLENQIQQLEKKISDLQAQENTLSSQIDVADSQIKLTEFKIKSTKQQILNLEEDIDTTKKKIGSLEESLKGLIKLLISRVVAGYEYGGQNDLETILNSSSVESLFIRASYIRMVQNHDRLLVFSTVQAKNDYSNQQKILEDKKQKIVALQLQLESYTQQLGADKNKKQRLLTETQGSEDQFQKLLTAAKSQLAGFSGFAQSQGGAALLDGQDYCDDWGCYYNQRDKKWGSLSLNHTQYTIASDGCLLTSVAMLYTHYGHRDVTPIAVDANPLNFASYYPAYLLFTITANGISIQRISSVIDSTLASGNPVIVGIRYGNGDTHFVVLKSGSGGNYVMNDPFTPNGHDIVFSSKYSLRSIFEVDKMVFL